MSNRYPIRGVGFEKMLFFHIEFCNNANAIIVSGNSLCNNRESIMRRAARNLTALLLMPMPLLVSLSCHHFISMTLPFSLPRRGSSLHVG